MSVVCAKCGQPNDDKAQFCTNPSCGEFLSWDGARRPDAEPVQPPVEQRSGAHLEMSPPQLRVLPGASVTAAVTVHNTGTVVDRFRVSVVGDAAGWARVEPGEVVAYPEGSATCTVEFAPPPPPASRAGTSGFEVHADSIVHPGLRAGASGALTVERVDAVAAKLSPQTTRGGAVTTHQLEVDNRGNAAAELRLSAEDAESSLAFDLPPQVVVQPGRVAVPVQVRSSQPVVGRSRQVPFRVTAEPAGGRPVTVDGIRVVQPRLRIWQAIALVVAVLAVVSLAVLVVGAVAGGRSPSASGPPQVDPNQVLVSLQRADRFSGVRTEVTVMAGGQAEVHVSSPQGDSTKPATLTPEELGALRDDLRRLELGASEGVPRGDYVEYTLVVNGLSVSKYPGYPGTVTDLPSTWVPVVTRLVELIDRASG